MQPTKTRERAMHKWDDSAKRFGTKPKLHCIARTKLMVAAAASIAAAAAAAVVVVNRGNTSN